MRSTCAETRTKYDQAGTSIELRDTVNGQPHIREVKNAMTITVLDFEDAQTINDGLAQSLVVMDMTLTKVFVWGHSSR